jgi:hypothetical protein
MEVFFNHMVSEQRRIAKIFGRNNKMLPLTTDEMREYKQAVQCKYCGCAFTEDNRKVRHHDH